MRWVGGWAGVGGWVGAVGWVGRGAVGGWAQGGRNGVRARGLMVLWESIV